MTAKSQDLDLGILIGLAYQEFVRELRDELARLGYADAGPSYGYVFRSLDIQPMNTSELADRLAITKQGAAQLIEEMEARGYVERRPDPADRRAKLLYLTEQGATALATARRFHRDFEKRLAHQHGGAAVGSLRRLLTAIAGPERLADPRLRAPHV